MTPDDLDELFFPLIVTLDQLDADDVDFMADAYDRAGDVDMAAKLWELAEQRRLR
ncbi:hypothetical protein [Nocardia camponoti]|uniref:Uncharacterized protein n=1 Tax=Nocardia camponoti TaxID=1616106 RepID=A0A917VDM4_9NOCA|nr:hypothetical protein [Nocardia camponoti]GGK65795.1 hypothetical protein GCM10011591_42510 [Nocardia camponoti]